MKYVVLAAVALSAVACSRADDMNQSLGVYKACLAAKAAGECENERLAFEADRAYSETVAQRRATGREINCTTVGNRTVCR